MSLRAIGLVLFLAAGASMIPSACTTRDCSEDRAGQARCISNRLELCNDDGTVSYQSCTANALFCSEIHKGCVTKEVLSGSGGGGMGGAAGMGGAEGGSGANGGTGMGANGGMGGAEGGSGGAPIGGGGAGGA
jgi:hypothetical protein